MQRLDLAASLVGEPARGAQVGIRHDACKLFPAITRSQIAGPTQRLRMRAGDRSQALVTGGVSIAIVVRLEHVDVDHRQGQRLLRTLGAPPLFFNRIVEAAAVGEAGQAVEMRLQAE